MYPPAVDRLVARVANAKALNASILARQTSAEDAGRMAQVNVTGNLDRLDQLHTIHVVWNLRDSVVCRQDHG
jgi:hypothetical protein